MRTIIALAMVLAATSVKAAPALLQCQGTFRDNFEHSRPAPGSASISIDIAADTLVWSHTTVMWTFHNLQQFGDQIIAILKPPAIDWRFDISINRITGRITWNQTGLGFTPDNSGSLTFEGVCKPALGQF